MKKLFFPLILILCVCVLVFITTRNTHTKRSDSLYSEYEDEICESVEDDGQITIIGKPDTCDKTVIEQHIEESSSSSNEVLDIVIPRLIKNYPHQSIKRVGYSLSYNNKTKNANWVAWHLTSEHTDGRWKRDGIPYMVDDDVIGSRQELEDWYGHNLPIDHGHMCPAGDNKWSKDAMEQTFLLTNMCPQNSELNRGDREELESRCRGWARHYGDIYIVCGPIFYSNSFKTIGKNKVGVPDAFFKVVLCMNKRPKALGFIYPNEGTHHKMNHYVTTVDDVEKQTGIDFFYNLPDDIETKVEAESNLGNW